MLRNLKKKVLVTTPIFYINSKPHIGHIYTLLYSEFAKRSINSKLFGDGEHEALLSTGVDEHGKKVYSAAVAEGLAVKDYSDKYAQLFKDAVDEFEVDYDVFQRTTDSGHVENVERLWEFYDGKGWFSQEKFKGFYHISDEEFIKERDLKNYE